MKILVLGANQGRRYNWGHQLFKDEIAHQHNVRFYGEGHRAWDPKDAEINSILRRLEFSPDLILSYMGKYCRWVKGLDRMDIPKAHIVVDYFPHNYAEEDDYIRSTKQRVVYAVCRHEVRSLIRNGHTCKAQWLPFSVDTEVFKPVNGFDSSQVPLDVLAVFSVVRWAYPTRVLILETIRSMPWTSFTQESWPKTRLLHGDYVAALARALITVNGVDHFGSLNWKFLEPCACGSLLLTEEAEDMGALGFVDGETCVTFHGMIDMVAKIDHLLSHPAELQALAERGHALVKKRHSNVVRVQELTASLEEEFGIGG